MNNGKTALLLVDTQNDFLSPEGKMHAAVKPILDSHDMPNRLNLLIRASREAGSKVIFTHMLDIICQPVGQFCCLR